MLNVVFLPGVNNVASLWEPVVAAMQHEFSATMIDLPALESVEEIAAKLRQQLPDAFVLVGHSFGGMVGLAMLEAYPQRIQAITLIATRAEADTPAAGAAKIQRAADARVQGHEKFVLGNASRVFHPDYAEDPQILKQREKDVKAYGTDRYVAHNIAMANRPDRTQLLLAAPIPKLVVVPGADLVIPADYQLGLASKVGATSAVIEDTGHMLPAENPARLAAALDSWLESIEPEITNN